MSNDERAAPRRQVLDSSLFPQITDTIIDFAPTRCLQALRVNKGFRDLVDSHLAYHLAIHKLRAQNGCPLNRYEVLSYRGVVAQIDFTPETTRLMTASYFRSARILDISIAARWPSMMPALVQAGPDAAFRFNERTNLRHLDFCNATVVSWGEEKPTRSSGFLAYGIDEVKGINTLVIHLRAPGRRDDMFDLSVKHLVLILHPWEISITEAIIRDQYGIFWDFLWSGFVNRIPIAVFNEFDLGESMKEVLSMRRPELGLPDDSPLPRFLNFEEYESEVGNDTYQIHVNSGFIHRPHNTVVKYRE